LTDKKQITCVVCPIGCKILIKTDGKSFNLLSGNKCKRGIEYAKNEALDPRRMLTSSIFVKNGEWPLVSVKSSQPIQKQKVFSVLKKIKNKTVSAPVKSGQIIIKNVANSEIDIVATKSIKKIK
jgi:CxxC motif-containing protein